MYRKRNGSMGFSFTRFANAAVPNFFSDDNIARASDLTPQRRDMCYAHQTASDTPYALDDRSFYVAGVTDNEGMSKKVYKALHKHKILTEDGSVDTYKIGPQFSHQIACINVVRQRELINMLFWWEEECQRLRKIKEEEKELDGMITESEKSVAESAEDNGRREMLDQLKFARERVRMKRRQRPSQRRPDVEMDQDDLMDAFLGRSKSAPQVHSAAMTREAVEGDRGQPPEYYAVRH